MITIKIFLLFFFSVCTAFRYYDLALQKCNESTPLTIHGLWPQYTRNTWPQYCGKINFTESDLAPIREALDRSWYSCKGPEANLDFWTHEIEKHYSCVFVDGLAVVQYMNITLNLYERYRYSCGDEDCCMIDIFTCFSGGPDGPTCFK